MKIAKPTDGKKRIIIYSIIALVLLGGSYVAYTFIHDNSAPTPISSEKKESINSDPPTGDQVTQGQNIKKESIDQATSEPSTKEATMTLISNTKNISSIQLRTLIDKTIPNGTCILSLAQSDKSYADTVTIQNMPSTSTCKGFDIPLSRLSSGSWTGTIKAQDGSDTVAQISISLDI